MTVARRLSWRARSDPHSGQQEIDESSLEPVGSPEGGLDTAWWIHEAIQSLGTPCCDLILSLFFDPEEPTYAEVAVRLGRPVGSIGPLRIRCLERLREALETSTG